MRRGCDGEGERPRTTRKKLTKSSAETETEHASFFFFFFWRNGPFKIGLFSRENRHQGCLSIRATHCTVQHTITHCNVLQHTAPHYNTLSHNGETRVEVLEHRISPKLSNAHTHTYVCIHIYIHIYLLTYISVYYHL